MPLFNFDIGRSCTSWPNFFLQAATESINRGEAAEVIPQLDGVLQSLTDQFGRDSTELIEPLALRGKALASLGDHQSAIVALMKRST